MADDGAGDGGPPTSPGLTPLAVAPPEGDPATDADPGASVTTGGPAARQRHRIPLYGGRRRRMRRWPRRILVLANLLVFVLIAGAATVVGYGSYELNTIHRIKVGGLQEIPAPTRTASHPATSRALAPFTMLIVGSDTRALKQGVGLDIGSTTTNPEDLSDSIILARVDPAEHKLALLSIPRDLFVSIPGIGEAKINAAFAGNNASRLIKVITDDLGIPINHYAAVNFYTFEQIAAAIGGVPQYFPTPAYDLESGLQIAKAGCVNLKGAQALAFVRSRNYFYVLDGVSHLQQSPESDLGRIQRQQAFIKAAIKKTERTGDLTNPVTLTRLIGSITKNLSVDSEFSDSQLISLAESFSHVDANAIPNLTYPVVNNASGSGLLRVPTADAATVAKFDNFGATPKKPKKPTTPIPTTTTSPAYGNAYSSGTKISPASSSFFDGVYIPPGRVTGQIVQTCGD
jgi:LCP family protein required for cell wall assembly